MTISNRTSGMALSCAIFLSTSMALAQDWPQWRGANRDGKATFSAPQTWPKELSKKWKVTVGMGDATPAIVGDKVYVFAKQGNDEILQCLSAADGKPIWTDKYSNSVTVGGPASKHQGPRSSPAVADGKVVTLDEGATLSCLGADDGKVLWRKDFSKDLGSAYPRFNTATSPIIVDGVVVAHLGGNGKGTVLALDIKSGDTKWKWEGDGPAYASPSLMTVEGTRMIVQETEKSVIGLSAADGKLLWQFSFGGGGGMRGGMRGGPPGGGDRGPGGAPGGDRGGFRRPGGDRGGPPGGDRGGDRGPRPDGAGAPPPPNGALQADAAPGEGAGRPQGGRPDGGSSRSGGDRGRGGFSGRGGGGMGGGMSYNAASPVVVDNIVIVSAPGSGTKAYEIAKDGDKFAAKELWTNAETTTQFNTPVARDGKLFGISGKGNLFCMDAKTGKTLWTDSKSIGEKGFGTVVDAGSVLVALTPSSELLVFKPSDKEYSEVARIKVAGSQTYTYPVLAGNRVIIKDQDAVTLYTIE